MRNHDEKIKDISRSVLPSTGRKGARDTRRIIHKRHRTRELAGLTEYRRAVDPDDETPDFRGKAAPEITQLVRCRRARDKIGPLVRWAQATIAADPYKGTGSGATRNGLEPCGSRPFPFRHCYPAAGNS